MRRKNEVFIVGGGPSLKGFDFSKLAGLDTIAVNMAALDVPSPTYCITADSKIFKLICDGHFKNVDTAWVLVTNPEHATMKYRNGKFIRANSGYVYNLFAVDMLIKNAGTDGIGFSFKDFRTGYNSGFCAFQLAYLLGYHRICLLGFDLQEQDGGHYHDKYKGRKIEKSTIAQFRQNFVSAFEILGRCSKVEIISCSRTSSLNDVILFVPFDDVSDLPPPISLAYEALDLAEAQAQIKLRKMELIRLLHDAGTCNEHPKLSILICSIQERENQLKLLLHQLLKQKTDDVEILVEIDNKKISTGEKRNILLNRAKGEYIAFVDDDDHVDQHYVKAVLRALKKDPDCVGFMGHIHFKSKNKTQRFIHSIKYRNWYQEGGIYYRNPNHLNPVKRDLALSVMFPPINTGEDKDYSLRLLPLLKREVYIDRPVLYYYMTG